MKENDLVVEKSGWFAFYFSLSQGKYLTKVNNEFKEITTEMLMTYNHCIEGDNGWIEMPYGVLTPLR